MLETSAYIDLPLWIGGEHVETGDWIEVVDPGTESVIARVARAGPREIETAITAAAEVFRTWRGYPVEERAEILVRAADIVERRMETVASLLSQEQGKPMAEARAEVGAGCRIVRHFAAVSHWALSGRLVPPSIDRSRVSVILDPVGPAAAMTPWNFPFGQSCRKVAAALAAGCTVVHKPAEETPAAAHALAQALMEAGLPNGALNIVNGDPRKISSTLISDTRIKKVSFTGSSSVGSELGSMAGRFLKPATLELGGHAPVIIASDAEIERAAENMAMTKFRNSGQVCISPTRFLIEKAVYDRFVDRFIQCMGKVRVGHGHDENVTMGPLAHDRRVKAIDSLKEDAVGRGAELIEGPAAVPNAPGYWSAPTVITGAPLDARVMIDEPFGPLAIMRPVKDLDQAIEIANANAYGLASYAWTMNRRTMQRIAAEVETGMVLFNGANATHPEMPFGGMKSSGYGLEGGPEAVRSYLKSRAVSEPHW